MKSVSIKDDKGALLIKVSHKKKEGCYEFERFSPGLGHLHVLIVTDKNERIKIGNRGKVNGQ